MKKLMLLFAALLFAGITVNAQSVKYFEGSFEEAFRSFQQEGSHDDDLLVQCFGM